MLLLSKVIYLNGRSLGKNISNGLYATFSGTAGNVYESILYNFGWGGDYIGVANIYSYVLLGGVGLHKISVNLEEGVTIEYTNITANVRTKFIITFTPL